MMTCLFEANGRGLVCFVRYSPEGTVYNTYGTTCWETLRACVIYQSWFPSGPFSSVASQLSAPNSKSISLHSEERASFLQKTCSENNSEMLNAKYWGWTLSGLKNHLQKTARHRSAKSVNLIDHLYHRIRTQIRSNTYIFCHLRSLLVTTVKNLFVVVHPHLSQSYLVASNHLRTLGEGVGALCAENMTNDGARDDLQLSSTLPHLQVNGRQHRTDA